MALSLKVGTTSRLGLTGLKDADDTEITNATVTATLIDKSNTPVSGQSWPLSLTHDANGNYYGNISEDVVIRAGKLYVVDITAVSGSIEGRWRYKVYAEYADGA